jgi:autotransporter-associated beta strand protein
MLGNASGGLTFDGASFAPTAGFTTSRPITITGAGLQLAHTTGTVAFNGAISGSGDLRISGTGGTTSITGSNAGFSGAVRLSAGTLSIANNNALGTTGEIDMAGGTLTLASGITGAFDPSSRFSSRPSTTYIIANSSGNAITFASDFGNGSSFTKQGTSDIILSAANGIAGTVAVSNGALVITNAYALGYGDVAALTTVSSGFSLVLRGSFTLPSLSASSVTRNYNLNGTGWATGGYNGALWFDSGTVTVPGDVNLTASATIGTGSTGGLILTGAISLGASRTLTTRVDGSGNVKLTGFISGAGTSGITKTGAYTTELAPAASSNTYPGATSVQVGTLLLTSETPDTVLPVSASSAVVLSAGATLQTSTGTLQKGRATLKSLDNTAGGIIHIGG